MTAFEISVIQNHLDSASRMLAKVGGLLRVVATVKNELDMVSRECGLLKENAKAKGE